MGQPGERAHRVDDTSRLSVPWRDAGRFEFKGRPIDLGARILAVPQANAMLIHII
jgi:hypothetical protein